LPAETIPVKVIWPDQHSVQVEILIWPGQSALSKLDQGESLDTPEGRYFDGTALDAFDGFLAELTEGKEPEPIHAWCSEHLRRRLRAALKISGPVTAPVDFNLKLANGG
jgi:hypothetical protein